MKSKIETLGKNLGLMVAEGQQVELKHREGLNEKVDALGDLLEKHGESQELVKQGFEARMDGLQDLIEKNQEAHELNKQGMETKIDAISDLLSTLQETQGRADQKKCTS